MARKKTKKPRIDWTAKRFAVVFDFSVKCSNRFSTLEQALSFVNTLPLDKQAHAFIGEFKPVVVKSTATLGGR